MIAAGLALGGCASVPQGAAVASSRSETCVASVYHEGFGRPLADGRRHRPDDVLAAHRTHAFGRLVRVTVLSTGRVLNVPIRDRGPFIRGRCIDLSRGAARVLGVSGLARVRVEPLP